MGGLMTRAFLGAVRYAFLDVSGIAFQLRLISVSFVRRCMRRAFGFRSVRTNANPQFPRES